MVAQWTKPTGPIVAAVAAIEAQDYDEAEWLLRQVGPQNKEAYQAATFYRARIDCARGDHEHAQKLLMRAIGIKAEGYLYYFLGACQQHQERWADSEPTLARAVTLDPRQTDAFILRGLALRHLGRDDEAYRSFEQALANDPRAKVARFYLAEMCLARKEYKRALAQLHVLEGLQPDYAPTHRLQAEIHLALGDRRQALVDLCWLADQGHAEVWAFTAMGYSYEAIGEKEAALVAFERALRLDSDLTGVMAAAAKLNEELERYSSAAAFYRALSEEAEWADRARNALERLDRKLAFCRLMGKPDDAPLDLCELRAPEVAEKPREQRFTAPMSFVAGGQRTMPIAPPDCDPDPAYTWAAERAATAPDDSGDPLALRLARNVAALTKDVAADPTALLQTARGFLGKLRGKPT